MRFTLFVLIAIVSSSQTFCPFELQKAHSAEPGTKVEKREPTLAKRPASQTTDTASKNPPSIPSNQSLVPAKPVSTATRETKTAPATSGKVLLQYRLKAGTKIVSEVTHLAKTHTKINDEEQTSQSRTISQKVWYVKEVADDGRITFVHQVDSVNMSQQIGDGEELRYDSKTDREPVEIFRSVAETIGKPISTITITPSGTVVERSNESQGSNLGLGDITIPLPEEPIGIGDQWETTREIRIRRDDGTPKTVKVRELYTLEKFSAGVAVIAVRSEPLTPTSDAAIEAQVMQQMSNGTVRFDADAGQLISKNLAWDRTVVGFSGVGSVMDYSARLDEVVQK